MPSPHWEQMRISHWRQPTPYSPRYKIIWRLIFCDCIQIPPEWFCNHGRLQRNLAPTLPCSHSGFLPYDMSLKNKLKKLKKLSATENSWSSTTQETDYSDGKASAKLINDWVEKITQDKIKDLIKPDMLNALTRLVLVNAIYFKGDWKSKFDAKKTVDEVGF